jgi:hypothetical protein
MMNKCYLEFLTIGVKVARMHPYHYHVKSREVVSLHCAFFPKCQLWKAQNRFHH